MQSAPRPWPLAPEPEPVFGMLEVCFAFGAMLAAVIFCGVVAVAVAHHMPGFSGMKMTELANETRVLLPAQLAAYCLVLAALWRLFGHHFGIGFWRALAWRWPGRWPVFVIGGVVLAVVVQVGAHFLPSPPELPVDKMMRTASDAWMMSIFGVLIAPFVEEVLFRGLLFPALTRRMGALAALLLSSLVFGAFHAQQLAGEWIQVSCIVVVSVVLTGVRWRFRSLASSTLVHVGYNGTLFAALFVQTNGFTNLLRR